MVEQWGIELLYGIGRMFYNPLLYWILILLFIAGFRRIKQERKNFGVKIYDYFNEIKETLPTTLIFGLLLSLLSLTLGVVVSKQLLLILAIVTILVSMNGSFQWLSPVYTLGITLFILIFMTILPVQSYIAILTSVKSYEFGAIALLMGILLLAEAYLIRQAKGNHLYPSVKLSERGIWIGEQELKRMAVIPFFVLIPSHGNTNLLPILPYIEFGEAGYYLVLLPFILGTQMLGRYEAMPVLQKKVSKQKALLALVVIVFAILSYVNFYLAFVAVIVAMIGHEWITYRLRLHNEYEPAYFAPTTKGIKVLATLPASRAADLGILPGEVIHKVNGQRVTGVHQFYQALQGSGAFFKLEIYDARGEIRFVQSAFYEEDHHELGLIFPDAPYKEQHKVRYEELKNL